MSAKRFNIVTFRPDGGSRIFLSLEGQWVMSAGLKPNVNRAIVPFTQFDLLSKGDAFLDAGTVEFWFSTRPGQSAAPDVSLAGWRIVDVEATESGTPRGMNASRITEYRLHLADARERFIAPKGGILTRGSINGSGLRKEELTRNSILIRWCLEAMGITASIPEDVDAIEPARGLQWNGTHAPTELAKLLDHCFAAFLVMPDGRFRVEMMVNGNEPAIPVGRQAGVTKLPGIGRRGKTIVITSAPYPVIDTRTMAGPSETTWEFVVRDYSKSDPFKTAPGWAPIEKYVPAVAGGVQASAATIKHFQDIADPDIRTRLLYDAWRFIRLSAEVFDPRKSPGLRVLVNDDGTLSIPRVRAKTVIRGVNGGLTTATTLVDVPVLELLTDQKTGQLIVALPHAIGKVAIDDAPDFYEQFLPLKDGELEVEMSFEASADGKKQYFTTGYHLSGKGIEKLKEDETRSIISSPGSDAVFLSRRELRLRLRNKEEINRDELEVRAKTIAAQYLAGSQDSYIIQMASGFLPGQLSGKLAEVRWDQRAAMTTFKVNSWHYPLQAAANREALLSSLKEAFSGQSQTQQERQEMGGSGASQPAVSVLPASGQASSADTLVVVKITASGQDGKFSGQIGRGRSTAGTANALAMPEGLEFTEAGTCLVLHLAEDGLPGHRWLRTGSYVLGKVVGRTAATNPLPIVMVVGPKDGMTFAVAVTKDGGADGTQTTAATWTYTVKSLGGQTLGETVPVSMQRPFGKRKHYPTSGYGLACFNGTGLILLDAGEVEETGGCP